MASEKEIVDRIAELEKLKQAHENRIRTTRTNKSNPAFFDSQIEREMQTIARAKQAVERLIYSRDHADDIIADEIAATHRIAREIKILRHQREINQLLRLQAQIEKLSDDVSACEVQLYFGEHKWRACGKPATGTLRIDGKTICACDDCIKAYERDKSTFNYRGKAIS